MSHLYEVVISNSRVWLKVQGSCESTEQAGAFFECGFTGTDYIVDEQLAVTPFRGLGGLFTEHDQTPPLGGSSRGVETALSDTVQGRGSIRKGGCVFRSKSIPH